MMMNKTYSHGSMLAACVVTVALALPSLASAQAQTTPRPQAPRAAQGGDAHERLEDRISFRIETDDLTSKYDIDVDADRDVITLSGKVATERQKTRVIELAKVDGVVRIEDRIEVDPDVDRTLADRTQRGLSKAGQAITDTWITTKVHWFFMGEDLLDGSDIDVDTSDRVVTLKGRVPSEAARARARVLAERTDGVREIRDELVVSSVRN
jgi:hyperosmotically inducible periplasmic protein